MSSEWSHDPALEALLNDSLDDLDLAQERAVAVLVGQGRDQQAAVALLARYRSSAKYGYEISPATVEHVLGLRTILAIRGEAVQRLFSSPFFICKACWLYDHAPYFLFADDDAKRDGLIDEYASFYADRIVGDGGPDPSSWTPIANPKQVFVTTFWERQLMDPVLMIEKAYRDGVAGIELSVDFHPFNYARLLPEEIPPARREKIRLASERSGVRIDLHAPLVGPYVPSPDPSCGTQRFFDPTRCLQVQFDTIDLARDIGAGVVVMHLVRETAVDEVLAFIQRASGSSVKISLENYCQLEEPQTSEHFLASLSCIYDACPADLRRTNLGVTIDVGHLNIEGEDPLLGAYRIGAWCCEHGLSIRMHATDNYGDLLFSPPAYSADVHSNVSGRGINNAVVIKALRTLGHRFDVVAEQLQPLTPKDIRTIHGAQTEPLSGSFEEVCAAGRKLFETVDGESLVNSDILAEPAYEFLAGLEGAAALREHLVYRCIQDKNQLSVQEAKAISHDFMRMPESLRAHVTSYIDELLLPLQNESGRIQKGELDLICQNISGAVFGTISNEHMKRIFCDELICPGGNVICEQGKPGREMFFVRSGHVVVFIDGAKVAELGPGEIFGELSLFYSTQRSATVVSGEDGTQIGVLTRQGLEQLFRTGEPYAHGLVFRLYSILPQRLRNVSDKYKAVMDILRVMGGDHTPSVDLSTLALEIDEFHDRLFPCLTPDELTQLGGEVLGIDAGQTIMKEGECGDGAYVILEGRVSVLGTSDDGQPVLLAELGENEIVGEMSLVDDRPRSATVRGSVPSRLLFLPRDSFDSLIATGSPLAFRVMGFICLGLFRRILAMDRAYSEIKQRIAGPVESGGQIGEWRRK